MRFLFSLIQYLPDRIFQVPECQNELFFRLSRSAFCLDGRSGHETCVREGNHFIANRRPEEFDRAVLDFLRS